MSEPGEVAGGPARMNRRKKTWIRVGVVAALLLFGSILFLNFQNKLSIVGPSGGADVLARQSFGAHPFIDVSLPVLGHVMYPPNGTLPANYQDAEGVSGLLFPDPSARFLTSPDEGPNLDILAPLWDFGADGVAQLVTNRGEAYKVNPADRPYARCPYIFGSLPRVAEVKFGSTSLESVRVKVPAMGRGEPKLASAEVAVGRWKVKLTPRPWISPSFALRYTVTLEGNQPNDQRFVELWSAPDIHAAFPMHEGDSKEFSFDTWKPEQDFIIRVYAIKEEPFTITVYRTPKEMQLRYPGGQVLYPSWAGWDQRYAGVKIGEWIAFGEEFLGANRANPTIWNKKNGDTVEAIGYRQVETGRGHVVLKLPVQSDYPRVSFNR